MKRLLLVFTLLAGCSDGNSDPSQNGPQYPVPVPVPFPTVSPWPVPVPAPTVTATPLPPGPNPMPTPAPVPVPTVWEAIHNDYRCPHGVQPLKWNQDLANEAQAWVNRCQWGHDPNNRLHGENLALGQGLSAEKAMQLWYDEGKNYPYGAPTPPHELMHFTQMVWKRTSQVGCALAQCPMGNYYACRYSPPGNYIGQFADNVLPPTNHCQGPFPLPGLEAY